MKVYIKKRRLVRIISFFLAALLTFAGSTVYNANKTERLKMQLVHGYQAAMESLCSEMENISITLGKATYTSTPATLTSLSNQLALQTGTAATALSSLPSDPEQTEAVSKFLNQVSDYSLSLSSKAIRGNAISDEERQNLIKLSEIAKRLSQSLNDSEAMLGGNDIWLKSIDNVLNGADDLNGSAAELTAEALSDYPTLIYDGPFSDHILEKNPEMLKNAKSVSISKAKQIAARYLNISEGELYYDRAEEGKMPSYVFSLDNGTISVTKQGGYVCFFRKSRDITAADNDYEGAVEAAKEYISSLDIGSFEASYYFADEGICVINFAYLQGDTVCYPDLIKIGVALDNKEIVFYEARGFLANHKARTLKVPVYTAKKAAESISPHLKIKSTRLAVIPSGGQNELYCYEFLCQGDKNEEVLVYVNTETLYEEQIFILLKTDGGTLTK